MRRCIFFALAFLLFCEIPLQGKEMANYDILMDQVSVKTADELQEKYGLELGGAGGGAMEVVRLFSLSFDVYHFVTLEEARFLLVKSAETLLKNINSCKEIRPYLIEYPFPLSGIEINLIVYDEKDREKQPGCIIACGISEGKLRYKTEISESELWKTLCSESYDQAKEKLLHQPPIQFVPQKKSFWRRGFSSTASRFFSLLYWMTGGPSDRNKYKGPECEVKTAWFLDNCCESIAKKYHLTFHRFGNFTEEWETYTYGFSFIGSQKLNLDQSRILGAQVFEKLFKILRTAPEIERYQQDQKEYYKDAASHPPLTDKVELFQTRLKIAFWDENVDRPLPPNIAQILFIDNAFHYYEADPKTQSLRLVMKESYDDAVAFKNAQLKK